MISAVPIGPLQFRWRQHDHRDDMVEPRRTFIIGFWSHEDDDFLLDFRTDTGIRAPENPFPLASLCLTAAALPSCADRWRRRRFLVQHDRVTLNLGAFRRFARWSRLLHHPRHHNVPPGTFSKLKLAFGVRSPRNRKSSILRPQSDEELRG